MREAVCGENPSGRAEDNVAAVVIFNDLRIHGFVGEIGGGIKMRDEADLCGIYISGRRVDVAVDIAVFVRVCVGDADFLHFLHQTVREDKLLVGGRTDVPAFRALRGDSDVFKKAFECFHGDGVPFVDWWLQYTGFFGRMQEGSVRTFPDIQK